MMSSLFSPFVSIAGLAPTRRLVNFGFHQFARRRMEKLDASDPIASQANELQQLLNAARDTRFGRDHGFASLISIARDNPAGFVAAFQQSVPLRTYEDLWNDYLGPAYPVLDNLTWPGRIPYFALTSGTTQGATKYIPVSQQMLASNRWAAKTMIAAYLSSRPDSRLFHGKLFFLGGSTDLAQPAPGVREGDLSAIASMEVSPFLRPYTFPPLDLAFVTDWEVKLSELAEHSLREPITLISGVPSWLLMLFQRVLDLSGKASIAEVWPTLEVVVHGGLKFDPYRETFVRLLGSDRIRLQETYPCSEGFVAFGDPKTELLRLVFDHGVFYEFVPVEELESAHPTRHWLGTLETGVNYAIVVSTCAGMWGHLIGDTVRFESLTPPLLTFTGRTKYTLSAFGEHLISEEVEAAVASASSATGSSVREWHVGPVFEGSLGHHQFVLEFLEPPSDLAAFREAIDQELCRRNADYQAHRIEGVGLPLPSFAVARSGGFNEWMRSRGKLGGQHKVPRMDNAGTLTAELVAFLRTSGLIANELPAGTVSNPTRSSESPRGGNPPL